MITYLIDENMPVVVMATKENTYDKIVRNISSGDSSIESEFIFRKYLLITFGVFKFF